MKYSVGELTIDTGRQCVSRDGESIPLPKLSYDFLLVLVQAAPNVVSLDELMRQVWPGIIVTPESVSQRVKLVRGALGDDARKPRYIAGVRGRGYQLVADVKELETEAAATHPVAVEPPASRRHLRIDWRLGLLVLVIGSVLAYRVTDGLRFSRRSVIAGSEAPSQLSVEQSTAAFSPPPNSIAVLPFVNLSGDEEQQYLSEGLTDELINSLTKIEALQVAARTSSFSFKEHPDIVFVARKLNVATVLEGSVQRSVNTMRVTVQLINAVTGFHLWSKTYDRDLGDVLQLRTEIATAVAASLKVTLLGDEAAKFAFGETHIPAALEAYLRASKAYWHEEPTAIDGYSDAIRLDSNFALAYADRSIAFLSSLDDTATPAALRSTLVKARTDAEKAIAIAPNLSEGHLALALVDEVLLAFRPAMDEFERALALGIGNARVLRDYGLFAAQMGHGDLGIKLLQRALALDPLNQNSAGHLANALFFLRRYPEARAAFEETAALISSGPTAMIGLTQLLEGDFEAARSICEKSTDEDIRWFCLALVYHKLGRRTDADAVLTQARAKYGDGEATAYAAIYAQRGNVAQALEWLELSARLRNGDLIQLKQQPLFDPLRNEPRFQAVLRKLDFP